MLKMTKSFFCFLTLSPHSLFVSASYDEWSIKNFQSELILSIGIFFMSLYLAKMETYASALLLEWTTHQPDQSLPLSVSSFFPLIKTCTPTHKPKPLTIRVCGQILIPACLYGEEGVYHWANGGLGAKILCIFLHIALQRTVMAPFYKGMQFNWTSTVRT